MKGVYKMFNLRRMPHFSSNIDGKYFPVMETFREVQEAVNRDSKWNTTTWSFKEVDSTVWRPIKPGSIIEEIKSPGLTW